MTIEELRAALRAKRTIANEANSNLRRAEDELDQAIKADLAERGIEIGKTPVIAYDAKGERMTYRRDSWKRPTVTADTFGVGRVSNGEIILFLRRKDGSVGEREAHLRTHHVEKAPE